MYKEHHTSRSLPVHTNSENLLVRKARPGVADLRPYAEENKNPGNRSQAKRKTNPPLSPDRGPDDCPDRGSDLARLPRTAEPAPEHARSGADPEPCSLEGPST